MLENMARVDALLTAVANCTVRNLQQRIQANGKTQKKKKQINEHRQTNKQTTYLPTYLPN